MKLAMVLAFFTIWGVSAVPVHAQTPVDPTIAFEDPAPCSGYCAELTYIGTTPMTFCDGAAGLVNTPGCMPGDLHNPLTPLQFLVPSGPDPAFPNSPYVYTCSTNLSPGFGVAFFPVGEFYGCNFFGTIMPGNTVFTISDSGGPGVVLALPTDFTCQSGCSDGMIDLTPSPEPATAFLYLTGLVGLIFSARKRFGVNSSA
jgi:hypothetical protein